MELHLKQCSPEPNEAPWEEETEVNVIEGSPMADVISPRTDEEISSMERTDLAPKKEESQTNFEQLRQMKATAPNTESFLDDNKNDISPIKQQTQIDRIEEAKGEDVDENAVSVLEKTQEGRFAPAILACSLGHLKPDQPLDFNSGLTLMHYASFYGNIKALKFMLNQWILPSEHSFKTLHKALLKKDTISVQENCENTPLHSAIIGGENAASQILLNFDKYLSYLETNEIEVLIKKMKISMLMARNSSLCTPLMLCITQDKLELFIYLLYTFKDYYITQGLNCIDINGNTLLHLVTMNQTHQSSVNFSTVLMNYSPDHFVKMINIKNNEGNTPLYLAVGLKNISMIEFCMRNQLKIADITLRNKSGDTLREFLQRSSGEIQSSGSEDPELFEMYQKYENRTLIKAVLGQSPQSDVCALSPKAALRAICSNWRKERHFVLQAIKSCSAAIMTQHRSQIISFLYLVLTISFNIVSLLRKHNDTKSGQQISYIVWHLILLRSILFTCVIINTKNASPKDTVPLPEFIIKSFESKNFKQVEEARSKFCLNCMSVHFQKQEMKINHCQQKGCRQCIVNYQKHSNFYGKCIGADNVQLYFFNILSAMILLYIWVRQAVWAAADQEQVDNRSFIMFWLASFVKIWSTSTVLGLTVTAVMMAQISVTQKFLFLAYAISRDQMSLHELNTIDVGGTDEDDDPYQQQRGHLYTIKEYKVGDNYSSSGEEADDEDPADRMLRYDYRRGHLDHPCVKSLKTLGNFMMFGPTIKSPHHQSQLSILQKIILKPSSSSSMRPRHPFGNVSFEDLDQYSSTETSRSLTESKEGNVNWHEKSRD